MLNLHIADGSTKSTQRDMPVRVYRDGWRGEMGKGQFVLSVEEKVTETGASHHPHLISMNWDYGPMEELVPHTGVVFASQWGVVCLRAESRP